MRIIISPASGFYGLLHPFDGVTPYRLEMQLSVDGCKDGKLIEKGTMCKMARGQMVRWLAENAITKPEEIKGFDELGYQFSCTDSTDDQYIFIKGDA